MHFWQIETEIRMRTFLKIALWIFIFNKLRYWTCLLILSTESTLMILPAYSFYALGFRCYTLMILEKFT